MAGSKTPIHTGRWQRDPAGSSEWHHRSGEVVRTPLSKFPLLFPQKWHLSPCSTHTNTEMSWVTMFPPSCQLKSQADPFQNCALSFLMVQQLLPGDFWSLPLSLLSLLCLPCLSFLFTLPPSLIISFYIEKVIDQISLYVLAFHTPLQKSIQWIPENKKMPSKVGELQGGWSERQRNIWREGEMVFLKQYLISVSGTQI